MKDIILIITYFGKLPNYFQLWLKSVQYNPTVNFLLVTDDKTKYEYPKNIKVIYSTFEDIQKRIKNIFDFKVEIQKPYKLCDYRPFYNIIFSEEVKRYNYWGFCDIDIIFGSIRKFVTEEVLEKYDKIYTRGHLTILKNSPRVNKIIKSNTLICDGYDYVEALSSKRSCYFDEWRGISKIFEIKNIAQYDEIDFADLAISQYNFHMLSIENLKEKNEIFEWEKGHLYYITEDNKKEEIIYAHFQKRIMEMNISNMKTDHFLIIPNEFIDYRNIDMNFIYNTTRINDYRNKKVKEFYRRYNKIKIKGYKDAMIRKFFRLIKKIKHKKDR